MTRASLLHILDNLGGISETEIQELEQLAATFPYCQTAHLLLAKSAHDRGSMLAAQRLRRAATYAVDRQRLRALIELPAPLPPAHLVAASDATRVETTPVLLKNAPQPASDSIQAEAAQVAEATEMEVDANSGHSELELLDGQALDTLGAPVTVDLQETPFVASSETTDVAFLPTSESTEEALPSTTAENAPQPDQEETFAIEIPAASEAEDSVSTEQAENETVAVSDVAEAPSETEAAEDSVETEISSLLEPEPVVEPEAVAKTELDHPVSAPTEEDVETPASAVISSEEIVEPTESELPPAAPLIRPPAEAGSSRFEFGLTETAPVFIPVYNLSDAEKAVAKQTTAIPSFLADEQLGYSPGFGSRLGFCLQAHDEYSLNLPPTSFFEPDALLLQYLQQHQPAPPPVPKSIDLINKFLSSKPRFRAPLPLPPTTEAQADLSVRSTVAEPGLASESLARILVRQGKIAKAIEIYERLMVRQPEKKAYFADQIQQLQTYE